jgi:hypothetical protein
MTDAVIVHQLPGRIRLRIPAMRGDANYFSALATSLGHAPNVQQVKTNPATASVVVQFEGDAERILEQMHELGLEPEIRKSMNEITKRTGIGPVRLVSGRDINPMFMAGSALALLGLVQTFRGKIVVPSVTAFWYTLEAFRASGRRG